MRLGVIRAVWVLEAITDTSSEARASAFGIRLVSRGLARNRKGSGRKTVAGTRQLRQVPTLKLRLSSSPPQPFCQSLWTLVSARWQKENRQYNE